MTDVIAWLRAWLRRGRHHHPATSELWPVGTVWFHGGTWWTSCRSYADLVERRFDRRSNPLDHDWVVEEYSEPRMRRRFSEKEYG